MLSRIIQVQLLRLALPFVCFCFGVSCAPPKALVPDKEQAQLLDSIPLLTDGGPSNWIHNLDNPITGLTANFQDGTKSGSQRLHLRWWEGSSFTKAIVFVHPDSLPFNCEVTENIGCLSFNIRRIGRSQSNPTLIIKLCDVDDNCSSTHLAPHHLERTHVDTIWQEVRVPFSDVQRGRSATSWTDILSFQFGLEGFGVFIVYLQILGVSSHGDLTQYLLLIRRTAWTYPFSKTGA